MGYSSAKITGGCGLTGNLYTSTTCTGTPLPVDDSSSYISTCQTSDINDDYYFSTASSLENYCNSATSLLPSAGLIATVAVLASGLITAVF